MGFFLFLFLTTDASTFNVCNGVLILHHKAINLCQKSTLNPSSPKVGCNNPTHQFSPWCSKSHSQGGKIASNSSFPFILAKKFEPTTYTGGRVSFQSWEVRGVGAIPWFLNWIILKIFEVICTPNFVCMLEWPFSNIFCKKPHENRIFLRFVT